MPVKTSWVKLCLQIAYSVHKTSKTPMRKQQKSNRIAVLNDQMMIEIGWHLCSTSYFSYSSVSWEISLHNKEQINWLCTSSLSNTSDSGRGGWRGGSLGKLSAMFAIFLHILSLEYTETLLHVCALPLTRGSNQVGKAEAAFRSTVTFCSAFCLIIKSKTVDVAIHKWPCRSQNCVAEWIKLWIDLSPQSTGKWLRYKVMTEGTQLHSGNIFDFF